MQTQSGEMWPMPRRQIINFEGAKQKCDNAIY